MIQVIYIYIFPILNLGWSFLSSPGVGDLRYHPAAREGDFQDLEDLPSRAMFWCLEFSGKANSKLHEQEILEKKIGGCKLHGGNSREKKDLFERDSSEAYYSPSSLMGDFWEFLQVRL